MNCPRNYQLRLQKKSSLPPHFHIIKGNLIHYAIEKALKHKSLPDYDFLLKKMQVPKDSYLENQVLGVLTNLLDNLQKWIETTEVSLKQSDIIGVEREFRMPIWDDYWLIGHIDLITKTHIIDFKSGKASNNPRYWMQLGMYRELAKFEGWHDIADGNDWTLMNVFLGNEIPIEYGPTNKQVEKVLNEYYDRLFKLIEVDKMIRANPDYHAPVEVGWLCKYCDFKLECRGV